MFDVFAVGPGDAQTGAKGVVDEFRQSTGFVLDPAGKVVVSVYSSGAMAK